MFAKDATLLFWRRTASSEVKAAPSPKAPPNKFEGLSSYFSPESGGQYEVLLLKVFDSRRDGRTRCGCHCAFFDPHGDTSAFRESIEVRCLVILPKGVETEPTFRVADHDANARGRL